MEDYVKVSTCWQGHVKISLERLTIPSTFNFISNSYVVSRIRESLRPVSDSVLTLSSVGTRTTICFGAGSIGVTLLVDT